MRRAAAWALALCLLAGCAAAGQPAAAASGAAISSPTALPQPSPHSSHSSTEELLQTMTVREKVGQLFIVRPDALDPALTDEQIDEIEGRGALELTQAMRATLTEYPVGGVALFGKNIASPAQLRRFTARLRAAGEIPLLVVVDEEGGPVSRLATKTAFGLPVYESAAAVGRQGDAAVYEMGQTIGGYLKDYGFTLNFAPVTDVNTNPANPIIGPRAFSGDPAQAAQRVAAAVQGFHAAGLPCTLKHFPGHGDTREDSHRGAARSEKTLQQLRECELLPFASGIQAGADAVMLSHIETPAATTDGLPASLSPQMVQLLRGELGFTGVIVTDSLAMQAITDRFSPQESALLALEAGCDVLLMPHELTATFDAVVAAVESGRISEECIDESVARVLALKQAAGLL